MMKQITKSEWYQTPIKPFNFIQLCHLPYSVKEIEDIFDLTFFEYTEEGLGICYAAFIDIETHIFLLKGADKEDKINGVLVEVKSFEKNLKALLYSICKEFKVNKDLLIWANLDL